MASEWMTPRVRFFPVRCETLRRVIASLKVKPGAMSQSSASWWIRSGNSSSSEVNPLRADPGGQIHTPEGLPK